jgi:hypothetical protein
LQFQYLADREPFTDVNLRDALRRRLNELDGVSIPEGKLGLRPSFPLTVLVDEENHKQLFATLAWFWDRAAAPETD